MTKHSNKRKRLTEPRQKRTMPMSKRVKIAVRDIIMKGKSIDEIEIPRAVKRSGGDLLTNFRTAIAKIKDTEVYLKKIDNIIGIGVFAKQTLEQNIVIRNVYGQYGNLIDEERATKHQSTIKTFNDQKDNIIQPKCRELNGLLSFFNHACSKHANCTTRFTTPADDYRVVQTIKRVKKDDELTIVYDLNCTLLCRKCK